MSYRASPRTLGTLEIPHAWHAKGSESPSTLIDHRPTNESSSTGERGGSDEEGTYNCSRAACDSGLSGATALAVGRADRAIYVLRIQMVESVTALFRAALGDLYNCRAVTARKLGRRVHLG